LKTNSAVGSCRADAEQSEESWRQRELAGCQFKDERLGKRFSMVLKQLAEGTAESIPLACQDWANTKAAYRFFANERVSEADILAGHFRSTRERAATVGGTLLVLHDTTEFSYPRENIGVLHRSRNPGRSPHPLCGISMHSSLVVTPAGLPLGLSAVKFWTRKVFKGTNELKRWVNPTRIPIGEKESVRWVDNLVETTALLGAPARCVHVGDREADIYELFCAANDVGAHFVIRSAYPRLAGDGKTKTDAQMQEVRLKGLRRITVRGDAGEFSEAVLELRYRRMLVLPPVAKQKDYGPLELTVLYAEERGTPKGRERISWKLLTDLPVDSYEAAVEKLQWYALRWKIELFHKILKSGCKVEESRLRTAPRLVNLIATCCVVAWRIFWITMVNRSQPTAVPALALTQLELQLLDQLAPDRSPPTQPPTLSHYIIKIARLGGYLARARDPAPGNIVMWRGLARLTDIAIGYSLRAENVGN
jgi:hypothetical protein